MGGLHCIKGNNVSFSKDALPFKKEVKEIGITSGHSRRCMNSGLTAWKKASIPQLLIHHKDHTLLCAVTVGENADAFQRVPSLQAFHSSGRSPAGKP